MLTIHKRRLIRERLLQGKSVAVIAYGLDVSRDSVRGVGESLRSENRRFSSPELQDIPQLTDDEADLASDPGAMNERDEEYLTGRIWSVATQIQQKRLREAAHA